MPSVCWGTCYALKPSHFQSSGSGIVMVLRLVMLLEIGKIILPLRVMCSKSWPCQKRLSLFTPHVYSPPVLAQHSCWLHRLGDCNDTFGYSQNLCSPKDFFGWPGTGHSPPLPLCVWFEPCGPTHSYSKGSCGGGNVPRSWRSMEFLWWLGKLSSDGRSLRLA